MSFSTTRITVHYVGAPGGHRPGHVTCTNPQKCCRIWGSVRGRREIQQSARREILRRELLAFRQDLITRRRKGRKMVVVLDNARYHHARMLAPWLKKHRKQLRLDFLPPYSPDLNPTERVWKLTRRLRTHNRYFPRCNNLSIPYSVSLNYGISQTILCDVYAQLFKTLCIAQEKCLKLENVIYSKKRSKSLEV